MGLNHKHSKSRVMLITIFINIVLSLFQVVVGLSIGSLAVLSDAAHNFSDVLTLVISYSAEWLSGKKHTVKETFGYKRAKILAAFFNGITLIIISVVLCIEAVPRLWEEDLGNQNGTWIIWMAILSILGNGISAYILHRHSKVSLNIRSAYLHLLLDLFSSIAVLGAGIGIHYFSIPKLDAVVAIFIAIYLMYASAGLLWETIRVLMHFSPKHVSLPEIERAILEKFPILANVHHSHLWQLTDEDVHFEAHIDFREDLYLSEVSKIVCNIDTFLKEKFDIQHIFLQAEKNTNDSKQLVINHE